MPYIRSETLLKQFEAQAATAEQIQHGRLFTRRMWDLVARHADEGCKDKLRIPEDIKSITPLMDCPMAPDGIYAEVEYRERKSDGVFKFTVVLTADDQKLLLLFCDNDCPVYKDFFSKLKKIPGAEKESQFLASCDAGFGLIAN